MLCVSRLLIIRQKFEMQSLRREASRLYVISLNNTPVPLMLAFPHPK